MKKILFIFLFYILSFNFFVFPAFAFSWADIFPPLHMQSQMKKSNPPVTDVENNGYQGITDNTYTNLVSDAVSCRNTVPAGGSASAKTKYDKDGNEIGKIFPYNFFNLNGEQMYREMSNSFVNAINRIYLDKGETVFEPLEADINFKEYGATGKGFLSRIYSTDQKKRFQCQMLKEVIKTYKGEDTTYADLQRAWDCNGVFYKMDGQDHTTTCRPVTQGEVLYFFKRNPPPVAIFTVNCEGNIPEPFPEIIDNYPGIYKGHFGVAMNLLPPATGNIYYTTLLDDFNITALGSFIQRIIVTNYESVLSQLPNFVPGDPVKYKRKRLIAGPPGNPLLSNQLTSVFNQQINATAKGFATPFDCDDYVARGEDPLAGDVPSAVNIIAYVHGLIKGPIFDQESISYTHGNPQEVLTESKLIKQVDNITNDLANFLPAGNDKAKSIYDKLKALPASSKVADVSPIDPGYQASEVYKVFRSYLHPQTWQDNYNKQI